MIRFETLRISASSSRLAPGLEERLELDRDVEVVLDRVLAAAGDEDDVVHARGDRLFDAVLDDRLVHQHQHLFRLRLGGGQEAGAEAGGGEDGFADAGHRHRSLYRPIARHHGIGSLCHDRSSVRPRLPGHRAGRPPEPRHRPRRRPRRARLARRAPARDDCRGRGVEARAEHVGRGDRSREEGRGATRAPCSPPTASAARQIKRLEADLETIEEERRGRLLTLPNLPAARVPVGSSAADNLEVRRVGEPRVFDFEPQAHWDLGPALGILDFERAARVSGARFSFLMGDGAQLSRALINFMLDAAHRRARLHRGGAAVPRQRGRAHRHRQPAEVRSGPLQDRRRLGSLPRADRRGAADQPPPRARFSTAALLPLQYCAYTPCFRSEAGSYGAGRPRPDPPAPVRQGGAGEVRRARSVARGTRIAHGGRRAGAGAPRAARSAR